MSEELYTNANLLLGAANAADITNSTVIIGKNENETYGTPGETFVIGGLAKKKAVLSVHTTTPKTTTGFGGTVYGAIVKTSGALYATQSANQTAAFYDITLDGGTMSTWSCTIASNVTINAGSWKQWQKGTEIQAVTINGGTMSLGGGNANMSNSLVNGGTLLVWSGTLENISMDAGIISATISGTAGFDGGTITGGKVIFDRATATATGNATLTNYTITGGEINVGNGLGAAAGAVTLANNSYDNCTVTLADVSGHEAKTTFKNSVIKGGSFTATNITISGNIEFFGGVFTITGNVLDSGANYTLHLDGRSTTDSAFIYGYGNAEGGKSWTVKIDAETMLDDGDYLLVGTENWNKNITLYVGESSATLSLNNTVEIGGVKYTTRIVGTDQGSVLALTVGEPPSSAKYILRVTATGEEIETDELPGDLYVIGADYDYDQLTVQGGNVDRDITFTMGGTFLMEFGTTGVISVEGGEAFLKGGSVETLDFFDGSVELIGASVSHMNLNTGDGANLIGGSVEVLELMDMDADVTVTSTNITNVIMYDGELNFTEDAAVFNGTIDWQGEGHVNNMLIAGMRTIDVGVYNDLRLGAGTVLTVGGDAQINNAKVVGDASLVAGTLSDVDVAAGKTLTVDSAAVVSGASVKNDGVLYFKVYSATVFDDVPKAHDVVVDGGTITGTGASRGEANGALIDGLTMKNGAVLNSLQCPVISNLTMSGGAIGANGTEIQHLRIYGGVMYDGEIYGRGKSRLSNFAISGGTLGGTLWSAEGVHVYDGLWKQQNASKQQFNVSNTVLYGGTIEMMSNFYDTKSTMLAFALQSDIIVSGGLITMEGGQINNMEMSGGEIRISAVAAPSEELVDSQGMVKLEGDLDMYGGKIVTTASEDNGVLSEKANLVLHIEGYEGGKGDRFVDNINKLGAVVDRLCVSVGVGQTNGNYQLVGFSTDTFDSKVTLASEGLQSCYLSVDKTATLGKNYTLRAVNGVLSMEIENGTATACNAEYDTGALAIWTEDTLASPGATAINIGNAGYAENTLVISGFSNGNITVFGDDAEDNDMSATSVRVNLSYGEIAAIVAGANSVDGEVGAISVIIGQGSGEPAAKVKAVYAGGFGSVNGDVTTIVNANAEITNGLFGGSRIKFDDNIDEANIAGDVSVTIAGASIGLGERAEGETRCLAAGNYVSGNGTSEIAGNVALTINDGEFFKGNNDCVFVAGYATNGATYNVGGSVNATIKNVTLENGQAAGRGVFGGAFASRSGTYALTTGGVNITVNDAEIAGNLFGGGWSQDGAASNVEGGVNITIKNSTVTNIFGGGAHGNTPSATTNVSGGIKIDLTNTTVGVMDGEGISYGAIYALGQCDDDTVTTVDKQNASIILRGDTHVGKIAAKYSGDKDATVYLTLNEFTGEIHDSIKEVDKVTISGETTATVNSAEDVSVWAFTFKNKKETADTAALTWEGGDFSGDSLQFFLDSSNPVDQVIIDLKGDGGLSTDGNPFAGTMFRYKIDDAAEYSTAELGVAITDEGVFAGKGFTYDEESGLLLFGTI